MKWILLIEGIIALGIALILAAGGTFDGMIFFLVPALSFFAAFYWLRHPGTRLFRRTKYVGTEEQKKLAKAAMEKALKDCEYLDKASKRIEDPELKAQIARMQPIAHRYISYLEDHPDKITSAYTFIQNYQARAVKMVRQFEEWEKTKLSTPEIQESKANIRRTLSSFDEAYETEFTKTLNDTILSMNAETKVMDQDLESKGIHNTGNTQAPEDSEIPHRRLEDIYDREGQPVFGDENGQALIYGVHSGIPFPEEFRNETIKRKLIAALLAIVLGSFGVHNFYLKRPFKGFLHLIFCWTMISGVIGIIEGIRYLFMSVPSFYRDYCRYK